MVNNQLPIKSVADYIRFARESKDGITFASSGSGSSIHLSGEMFKMQTKLNMLHVPYKGSAPAMTDLLGGQVDYYFATPQTVIPFIKAGKLRALAVSSAKRLPVLPDVPTVAESGYKGFDVSSWYGILAPAGTPANVVATVNTEVNKLLAQPDMRAAIQAQGAEPETMTSAQFSALLKADYAKWKGIVEASGAKIE